MEGLVYPLDKKLTFTPFPARSPSSLRYNGPSIMQVLQAGQHKFIYLELQPEMVASIARQAGFETKAKDSQRTIHLDLSAPVRQGPLLLFDAADPANLGWFRAASSTWTGAREASCKRP